MRVDVSIILIFVSLLVGYICGSIPFGILVGKIFFKKDPRDYGSGNLGATNVGRTFGKKFGFLTSFLDICKTFVPMWILLGIYRLINGHFNNELLFMDPTHYAYITGFGAVLGHSFPIFLKFKGGKSVSCFFALIGATNFICINISAPLFFLLLKITKKVSLSSIICAATAWIVAFIPMLWKNHFWTGQMWGMIYDPWLSLFFGIVGIIVIIRHKDNIKRLINGTERTIKWMK